MAGCGGGSLRKLFSDCSFFSMKGEARLSAENEHGGEGYYKRFSLREIKDVKQLSRRIAK